MMNRQRDLDLIPLQSREICVVLSDDFEKTYFKSIFDNMEKD